MASCQSSRSVTARAAVTVLLFLLGLLVVFVPQRCVSVGARSTGGC